MRAMLLSLLLVACGTGISGPDAVEPDAGKETRDGVAQVHPLDHILRVNHLQVKGTHNSYHVATPGNPIEEWGYSYQPLGVQLAEQGVRSVELDVHFDAGTGRFTVGHIPGADEGTTCKTFAACLAEVKGWSDAHGGHHPIFVLVEPKDDFDDDKIADHLDELDAEVLAIWPREHVLAPDDVRGSYGSLREAIEAGGWPTLGTARDKAIFLLLDDGATRDAYLAARPGLRGAVFFARNGEGEPWSAFLEMGNPVGNADRIRTAAQRGYLVRSGAGDHLDTFEKALADLAAAVAAGAHLIVTDHPALAADGSGYRIDVPGGMPSACNPVTAPPECTAEAL